MGSAIIALVLMAHPQTNVQQSYEDLEKIVKKYYSSEDQYNYYLMSTSKSGSYSIQCIALGSHEPRRGIMWKRSV